MELCPSGPLYLEIGNGIPSVMERLSQRNLTSRMSASIRNSNHGATTTTTTSISTSHCLTNTTTAATDANNNNNLSSSPTTTTTVLPTVLPVKPQPQQRTTTTGTESVVLRGRYCRFIDTHVAPDEIIDVLRMASCLPRLQRLCLLRLKMPLRALTYVLRQQASRADGNHMNTCMYSSAGLDCLQELELRSLILSASQEEMQEFALALQEHPSLTKIVLADCRPEGGTCRTLDALLVALSQMKHLTTLHLDMMELSRWIQSVSSFQNVLAGALSLQNLSLSYMRIPEEYIVALAETLTPSHVTPTTSTPFPHSASSIPPSPSLTSNPLYNYNNNNITTTATTTQLQELCLDRCDSLSEESAWVVAEMLGQNGSLVKLQLVVKSFVHAIPMACALQQNKASQLQELSLRTYHNHDAIMNHPAAAAAAAAAAAHPPPPPTAAAERQQGRRRSPPATATGTTASRPDDNIPTPSVYDAFSEMLQHNYSMLKLELLQGHPMRPMWATDPTLNFFLKVNRAGRRRLLVDHNRMATETTNGNGKSTTMDTQQQHQYELWWETIIAARADVECSFYFLSLNPSLCCQALCGRER